MVLLLRQRPLLLLDIYIWYVFSLHNIIKCPPGLLECGILNNPPNGGISATGSTVGSTVAYFCNGGYELFGNTFRVCQLNGQWSGSEPSCQSEFMNPYEIQY